MNARLRLAAAALAALAVFAAGAARAQETAQRKGFSVRIVEPKPGDIPIGETTIRAEVTAPRPGDVERVEFFVDDKLVYSAPEPPYQAVFDFGKKGGARVVRVVARHRDGPAVSDFVITRSTQLQYTVDVRRVVLDVAVRDGARRLVRGLSAADFSVVEEKRHQKVISVSPEKRPLLVGIVLDVSGSMRERMKDAQDAACGFIDALAPGDKAFVVEFDEQATLLAEPGDDRAALCAAARSTEAVGGTALFDAVHAAYRVAHELPFERRALVVLSDGDDNESRLSFDELLQQAQLNDVAVYAVGLDVGALTSARGQLQRLADLTGGRALFVKKASELSGAYQELADELRTLYQLVYESDNKKFDGRFLPVAVEVSGARGFDVRHRAGYRAVEP